MNDTIRNLNDNNWILTPSPETMNNIPKNINIPRLGLAARIPGDIYLDLLNAELIDDPFFGENERSLDWVSLCNWEYKTSFSFDPLLPFTHLVFDGLDTIADIYLNGSLVGHSENMFLRYSFDIKALVQPGDNLLMVKFYSAAKISANKKSMIRQLPFAPHPNRVFVRKAQFSFGWDWGPAFPGVGIWKNVYLENGVLAKIEHVDFETVSLSKNIAVVRLKIHFQNPVSPGHTIKLKLSGHKQEINDELAVQGGRLTVGELQIMEPQLWWPHTLGTPNLYQLEASLYSKQGQQIDNFKRRVGIRKVELCLKENGQESFKFIINDCPLFLKGANWIPADSFLPRVHDEKYTELITAARDANMNVLRVWGGGIYENDIFYDLCDRLGIMVWQDFMFACATYPGDETFLMNVKDEITQNVRRLKHHPSIILWCGNNEIEWTWYNDYGNPVSDMQGYRLFHELMPRWLAETDPSRPYWPSSPYGQGEDPNSPSSGNRHVWDIWSNWSDYSEVYKDKSLFVSEFGFQAPATYETFKTVLENHTSLVQNKIFEFHNKQEDGNERLFRFLSAHLPVNTEIEPFIFLTQLNQGFALKTCIEHWRMRWPKTAGSIIWQLNDCWPVSSWSIVDYALRRKHAYYFTKHGFQNVLPGFVPNGPRVDAIVLNDTGKMFKGKAKFYSWDIKNQSGKTTETISLSVKKNDRYTIKSFSEGRLANTCLIVTLSDVSGKPIARNYYLNKQWKHISLPEPKYKLRVLPDNRIQIKASTILFFLIIEHETIEIEDFPEVILPGEEKVLQIIKGELDKDSARKLKVRCLNNYLSGM